MRRFSLFASVLVVLLVGLVIAGRGSLLTLAQEGTPAAGEEAPEGITFTPLGFGTADTLPATPAEFSIARFTLDPGASFPIDPSDASVTLATIESGALTVQVDVAIQVTRAATIAAFSTPGADENTVPMPEAMAADTEFTMNIGDSAFYPANITGVVRNDGQEQAVVLIASIDPEGGGATGTPAP
jgi:quercetin dioxygenase-like cupin family protein